VVYTIVLWLFVENKLHLLLLSFVSLTYIKYINAFSLFSVFLITLPILCTIWLIFDVFDKIMAIFTWGMSYPISNVWTESSGKKSSPHLSNIVFRSFILILEWIISEGVFFFSFYKIFILNNYINYSINNTLNFNWCEWKVLIRVLLFLYRSISESTLYHFCFYLF